MQLALPGGQVFALDALTLVEIAPEDEFPAGAPLFSAAQQASAVELGAARR